jgi:hypothetical protein
MTRIAPIWMKNLFQTGNGSHWGLRRRRADRDCRIIPRCWRVYILIPQPEDDHPYLHPPGVIRGGFSFLVAVKLEATEVRRIMNAKPIKCDSCEARLRVSG